MLAASAQRINPAVKATKYGLFKVHTFDLTRRGRIIYDTLLDAPMLFASPAKCIIRSLGIGSLVQTNAFRELPAFVQFELYESDGAHRPATSHYGRHDGLKQINLVTSDRVN